MKSNVADMKSRAKETPLKSRYQRLERIGELSPDHALPDASNLNRSIVAPQGTTYLCVEEPPIPGWKLVTHIPTHRVFRRPNDLLLYRVLERFFGPEDLLGLAVREYEPGATSLSGLPFTADWGFSFQLAPYLAAEVRSLDCNSLHAVRFWTSSVSDVTANQDAVDSAIKQFLTDLKNAFNQNLHLFDEKQELRATEDELNESIARPGIINVSREKYQAAVRLVEAVAVLQDTDEVLDLDEPLVRKGSSEALLLGAATLFLVSLEAFINMLYALLLRAEFSDKHYERFLTRSDLDLRVRSLHVFCRGFQRSAILPDSDLWVELNQLREFRNDLVHGNVTDEHRLHGVREGIYVFPHSPFSDYRGPARERQVAGRIRRFTLDIDSAFVSRVRDIVDRTEQAVVAALETDLYAWARDLFDETVVLNPILAQQATETDNSQA